MLADRKPRQVSRSSRFLVGLVVLGLLARVLRTGPESGQAALFKTKQTAVELFPGAVSGTQLLPKIKHAVRPYGLKPGNTLYGQSTCPDEINLDKGHITSVMARHWNNVFNLGGLGGVPFVGKVGFGAFSGHVPKGGHIFVVFGPHVGLSKDGVVGSFDRNGQETASTACGAVVGAYKVDQSGKVMTHDGHDHQEAWISEKLMKSVSAVTAAEEPMAELAYKAYDMVEEEVMAIVNTNFGAGSLVLLGGIQINMPYPREGHFMPLHFSVRSQGMEPVDLLPALLGRTEH